MNRIKKGDQVIVIAGADKGKKGTVSRVAGDKLFVENINMAGLGGLGKFTELRSRLKCSERKRKTI